MAKVEARAARITVRVEWADGHTVDLEFTDDSTLALQLDLTLDRPPIEEPPMSTYRVFRPGPILFGSIEISGMVADWRAARPPMERRPECRHPDPVSITTLGEQPNRMHCNACGASWWEGEGAAGG